MATEYKPMRSDIFTVLVRRYEAAIMDAQLKIDLINEQPQIIPEHVDVTGEIDKLLKVIAGNKDKLAVLRQDYGTN